jgi:ribonuclease HI
MNLPSRRARLEQNDYFSSKNKRLNHYELYQQFYRLNSRLNCVS